MIIAYRLVPVPDELPVGFSSAACKTCMATGVILSGHGGGGDYVSPAFYERMHQGEFQRSPEAVELRAKVQRLRHIIASYGDRIRMANCARPEWQQEIDEALGGEAS